MDNRYIDAHMHVMPSGKFIDNPSNPPIPDAPEDVIAAMDAHDIEIGVIVPMRTQDNEFILQCQKRYPQRFVGCAMVHPYDENAVFQFQKLVRRGLCGLKLHPITQQFSDKNFKKLSPLIKEAGKLGVHVQIHCTPIMGYSTLEGVLRLAYEHPETNIILLHAALHRYLDLFPLSRAIHSGYLCNLYVDMSGTITAFHNSPIWKSFRWVMRQIGPEHLVFGSDFPAADISKTIEGIHALGFSSEEEKLIMRQNMVKILEEVYE
jgi:hypothetical protein